MCSMVVIVTRWWLAWLLASVAGVMAILAANLSPSWLMAHPSQAFTQPDILTNSGETVPSHTQLLRQPGPDDVPCLGLWLRCSLMYSGLHCGVYAVTVPDVHPAQIVSLVFVVVGIMAAVVACVGVGATVCLRTIRGTSCFTIITVLQALAGVCIVVCAALFPVAWDSPRVQGLCGPDATSYYPANCTLGWASYMVVCGGLLLLLCSCVSSRAAAASISSRVKQQIEKGNNFVFLL